VHALERCEAHPHGDGARAFYRAARRLELAARACQPDYHHRGSDGSVLGGNGNGVGVGLGGVGVGFAAGLAGAGLAAAAGAGWAGLTGGVGGKPPPAGGGAGAGAGEEKTVPPRVGNGAREAS
jgi:hypothetical protein